MTELKLEKIQMSGRGPKVMWVIVNERGQRQFRTRYGFSAWLLKREAKRVLEMIEEKGIEYVANRLKK